MTRTRTITILMVLAALGLTRPTTVAADAIKIGAQPWLPDVTLLKVENDSVIFRNDSGTELGAKLEGEVAVKFGADSGPIAVDQGKAEDLILKADFEAAWKLLAPLAGRGKDDFQKTWINYRVMQAADQVGKPQEAIEAFIRLATAAAPQKFFLDRAPFKALENLTPEQKTAALKKVEQALARKPEENGAAALTKLKEILAPAGDKPPPGGEDNPSPETPPPTGDTPVENSPPTPAVPPVGDGKIAVPTAMTSSNDPVVAALLTGQFKSAIEQADKAVAVLPADSPKLPERLYQLGLAELNEGLADPEKKLVKDAGLAFMRIVIYFGEGPRRSPYLGPALMEAGCVHHLLGDDQKAQDLYQRARNLIDDEKEPALAARLQKLMQEVATESPATQPTTP